ncbi:YrhK family protein [Pseudobythopirellula maris]
MFFVGSICFLSERSQTAGVWMFILGSGLMLVSSAAGVIDEYAQRQRE